MYPENYHNDIIYTQDGEPIDMMPYFDYYPGEENWHVCSGPDGDYDWNGFDDDGWAYAYEYNDEYDQY